MVAATAWSGGSLCALPRAFTVFRLASPAVHEDASDSRTDLHYGSLRSRASRCIHSIFGGTHRRAPFVHHRNFGGRDFADFDDRFRALLHSEAQNSTSPAVDDA